MTKQLELTAKDITWLGKAFADPAPLSPFSYIREEGFGQADKDRLLEAGLIGEDNQVAPDIIPLVLALSNVDAYMTLKLTNGPAVMRKSILFAGETTIGMNVAGEKVAFEFPSDPQPLLDLVRDYSGRSRLMNTDFLARLSHEGAWVLAALWDLYRIEVMDAYGKGEPFAYPGASRDTVQSALKKPPEHPQQFKTLLSAMLDGFPKQLSEPGALDKALAELVEAGWIMDNGEWLTLAGSAEEMAGAFLIFENFYELVAGKSKEGEIHALRLFALQAGVNDLLLIEWEKEALTLQTVSGDAFHRLVSDFAAERAI